MPDVQTLMTGLAFGESPRWHEDRLWFSHWGMQEVGPGAHRGGARSGRRVAVGEEKITSATSDLC